MKPIEREDIQIISRHSNWSEEGVNKALNDFVYNDTSSWKKFLSLFLIALGVCFTVSGVIFFFAYNWADLHKFAKIGLVEGLVITATLVVLFSKVNATISNIILTGAVMLVGALFAVFGQVYQTGANAYDFFLSWTMAATLWVVVSGFAPLWMLFLVLINTTIYFYFDQVIGNRSTLFLLEVLFILDTIVLIGFTLLSKFRQQVHVPTWFSNTIALACVSFATLGIISGIFDHYGRGGDVLIVSAVISYALAIAYGFKQRSLFYLSLIPFSIIVIVAAYIVHSADEMGMILITGLFIVISVTLVVRTLLSYQKKWRDE